MFANAVCYAARVPKQAKTGELPDTEIKKLETVFHNPEQAGIPKWLYNRRKDYETGEDKHIFSSDLDFTKQNDIKRLQRIKSYRGLRIQWRLPVRGQRTKSNFRKNKGKGTVKTKKKTSVRK